MINIISRPNSLMYDTRAPPIRTLEARPILCASIVNTLYLSPVVRHAVQT